MPWQMRHCSVLARAVLRRPKTVPPFACICARAAAESWQPEQAALIGESTRLVAAGAVVTPITAVDAIDVIGDFRESSKLGGRVTLKLSDSFDALPDEVRKAAEDAGGWLLIAIYNHRFRRR